MAPFEDKAKLICERLKVASDKKKSYADLRRRDIEYQVGDKLFLKISPWKKVLSFEQKGKLSLRFNGPYDVIERIGPYRTDPSHVVPVEEIEVRSDLLYEKELVAILDRKVKVLRNKTHKTEEATWESEDIMRPQYMCLFDIGKL
ncbi:uncharacterized protein [Gossypium hirsutum]|uniref:Tf2-1-like SH3-like domain-containing protein n=1 Tax=Gossypium hirsutum TaxID=3635 RepID=A0A1U8P8I3_GOSHI|nr:uncharacterized protein LOC107956332 [Gossypium hirsutum]